MALVQVGIRGMSTAEAGTPPVSMPLGSVGAQTGFLADVAAGKATRAALDDGLSPDAAGAAGRAASDDSGGFGGSSPGQAASLWPSMEGSYTQLRRLIDAHGPLLRPFAPIRGGVLAMSSFADVAELGFAERWLSVEELRPLVRQTLDEVLQQEGPGWDKAVEKWGGHRFWAEFPERLWSIGAAGLLRLSALLDTPGLFDPSASFYFSSEAPPLQPSSTRLEKRLEWLPPRLEWAFGKYVSGCLSLAVVNRAVTMRM